MSLNATIPWDVEIVGGTSKLQGKFPDVDLRSFELTGGVDQLRLSLGLPTGEVPIRLTGGANSIRIERPTGVPVVMKLKGGAGGIEFDQQKLGGSGGLTLESSGASDASNRYELEFTGGAQKIVVVELP